MTPIPVRRDDAYQPGQTALLLVDMQRTWLEPGTRSDTEHDDAEGNPPNPRPGTSHDTSDYFYRETAQRVVPNQQLLLKAARSAGVEVIHTIIRSLTNDGRDRSLDHKLTPIHLPPHAPEALPIPALAPVGDEILLPKTSSGVFNSTNINYLLRNLGIRYLVVAGIMTDQCVDMAVRDAADLGYLVSCVADACATRTAERHDNALRAFGGYCWLTDTATVVARFEALARCRP